MTNLALTSERFAPHVLYSNVRRGSLGYGIFFLSASLAEIMLAGALLLRPSPRVFRTGALLGLGRLVVEANYGQTLDSLRELA